MKIGVLGSGLMGKEIARDLLLNNSVKEVGIADIDKVKVNKVCRQMLSHKSTRLKPFQVNAGNERELANFIKQYDVVVNALYYTFNEQVAKTAIKEKVSYVDLGGHIGKITNKVLALHEQAKKAHVTVIPDLGVAPGMINIVAGYGASKLEKVHSMKLYVGGIPLRPEPPLGYHHVFSMEGLMDHYTDPSYIIRNHQIVRVNSLTEVEEIYFERFGPLEAFHTAGGTSTLLQTFSEVETLEYKTIRYPGHAEKAKLLVDLNLTKNKQDIEVDGQKVNPRKVLLKLLDPIIGDKNKEDVLLLRAIITGKKSDQNVQYMYEKITFKENEITAMARSTACTISIAAQMIGSRVISKYGVYPPEKIIPGDLYIKELNKRNMYIKEMETIL